MNIDYFNKDFYNQNTAYVISSYQPVKDASDLLRQAIKSILKFRDKKGDKVNLSEAISQLFCSSTESKTRRTGKGDKTETFNLDSISL